MAFVTVISEVTNYNACKSFDSVIVMSNMINGLEQSIPIFNDPFVTLGINNLPTNVDLWYWSFGDGDTMSNINNPTHEFFINGSYHICLIAKNECETDSSCFTVDVIGVGIEKNERPKLIEIYPNPAKDKLFIKNIHNSTKITISNMIGEIIYHNSFNNTALIDVSTYKNGIYLIRFNGVEIPQVLKFAKID
jgi:PKD repeat protein